MHKMNHKKETNSAVCCNCDRPFFVKDFCSPKGYRCPLLLQCAHTICGECVQKALQAQFDLIECNKCNRRSTVSKNLPLNCYVLGLLSGKQNGRNELEDSGILFKKEYKKSGFKKAEINYTRNCDECNRQANWNCKQCDVLYCTSCFRKIHIRSKALQKHVRCTVEESENKLRANMYTCDEHNNMKFEFVCTQCDAILCSHCVILSHHGHPVCTIKKKNEGSLKNLEEAVEKASNVLKYLQLAKKKVGDVLEIPSDTQTLLLEKEVYSHFLHLHGILQLMEEEITHQINSSKTDISHSLTVVSQQLEDNISSVLALLDDAKQAINPNVLPYVNMSGIIKRLEETSQIPCHLVTKISGVHEDYRFSVDKVFMEMVMSHCKLELPSSEVYALVNSENLPPGTVLESFEKVYCTDDSCTPATSGASSTTGLNELPGSTKLNLSITSKCDPNIIAHVNNDVGEGNQEIVTVCYITSPSCFYVHKAKDKIEFNNLNYKMALHIKNGPPIPTSVVIGGLYAVKYELDKNWYRVRVRSIIHKKNPIEEDRVEILYIDFGNIEIVPISRLRIIPAKLAGIRMLAVCCCLFGISPIGEEWSDEAIKAFAGMVDGCSVLMVTMNYSNNVYYVDLCEISGSTSKVPVSVRDAIVFLEHACFLDNIKEPVRRPSLFAKQQFLEQKFKENDIFDVCVSHIISPDKFFVRKVSEKGAHDRYLTNLMEDLFKVYSKPVADWNVFKPEIGMTCATIFEHKWYRAEVIGLLNKSKVQLFFVDYGYEEEVEWHQLKKLHERFFQIPKQAICCGLSDIKPILEHGWSKDTLDYYHKKSKNRHLKLLIDSVECSRLLVTIYDKQFDVDVCLNALLVREGYAISTGMRSQLVEFASTNSEEKDISPKKILKKDNIDNKLESEPSKNGEIIDSTCDTDPFRIKVKILALESPSCIYVRLVNYETALSELMTELQQYYSTSLCSNSEWTERTKCCVYHVKDKLWYRGCVVGFQGDLVEVFLIDFAILLSVPPENLRELDSKFESLHLTAITCYMVGIKAAGDRAEWPSLACEYLSELFSQYKDIFITKKGEIVNNSLPVEFWVKDVIEGGPLDPTIEEWNTLNKKLVNQGLAIPIKNASKDVVPSHDIMKEIEGLKDDHSRNRIPKVNMLKNYSENSRSTAKEGEHLENANHQHESSQLAWLTAIDIEKVNFTAVPTYVDNDAAIYLHDRSDEATLNFIHEQLQTKYKNSLPQHNDLYWFPGQICVAQYHADYCWYRAQVIEVNSDNTYKVQFVDYGNTEDCKVNCLRKNIILGDIPIVCHKCVLHGINPASTTGKWKTSELDVLHASIVEKVCSVEIKQFTKPYVISLIGPGNIDTANLLVQLNYAKYSQESSILSDDCGSDDVDVIILSTFELNSEAEDINSETIMKEESNNYIKLSCNQEKEIKFNVTHNSKPHKNSFSDDSDDEIKKLFKENEKYVDVSEQEIVTKGEKSEEYEKSEIISDDDTGSVQKIEQKQKYKILTIPNCDEMEVEVIGLLSATEFIVTPLIWGKSQEVESKDAFKHLTESMQIEAPWQPVLDHPHKGSVCCARYTDDMWYRAVVTDVTENDCLIQYVDYGNVESVPKIRVHKIKEDWLNIPIQVLRCKLFGVTIAEAADLNEVLTTISDCVFNVPLIAKIKKINPFLEVELLSKETAIPVCQSLLDSGSFINLEN